MRAAFFLCTFGCAVGLAAPQAALAQGAAPCSARFSAGFSRLPGLGQRKELVDPNRASTEVNLVFGSRQELCEAGAYQRFLDSFMEYARGAMHAPARVRDPQVQVAIAVVGQMPSRVPAEEARAMLQQFHQVKGDLYAIADDVKNPPVIQQFLAAFDRAGPPQPEGSAQVPAPTPTPTPVPPQNNGNVLTVRVPSAPLPSWAVVGLYEAREALRNRDLATAQGKLDSVLRWMEATP